MAKYSIKEKEGQKILYRGNKPYAVVGDDSVDSNATITVVDEANLKEKVTLEVGGKILTFTPLTVDETEAKSEVDETEASYGDPADEDDTASDYKEPTSTASQASKPRVSIETIRQSRLGRGNASRQCKSLLDQRRQPKAQRLENWIEERRRKYKI